MQFLSRRRSVDPVNFPSASSPAESSKEKDKESHSKQSVNDPPKTSRSRTGSDASVFRRVSTLFATRRRTTSKSSTSQGHYNGSAGIGYTICSNRLTKLPRVSSDSTPPSSPEIRKPSGLGRRASFMESDFNDSSGSVAVSEGYPGGEASVVAHAGFASLPNLLGSGGFRLSEILDPKLDPAPKVSPASHQSAAHAQPRLALPDQLLQIVLRFLPRQDLLVAALVSREFCSAARHTLYHSLDTGSIANTRVGRLYGLLARKKELAELVVSLYCPSWPSSSTGNCSSIASDVFRRALHNMVNLKILSIHSFTSILSHSPSPTFSLTQFTILDENITQSQLTQLRRWLSTQSSLQSLSFPNLVKYKSVEAPSQLPTDEWIPVVVPSTTENGDASPIAPLPHLKSLHASTQILGTLCSSIQHPIDRLALDVHDTLYTGLRPSVLLRPFKGVREMSITFAPEVDKRSAEKFLGVTGCLLAGENDKEGLRSLEVEVLWTDKDAAETLYGIVTAIISRFRGLQKLKLISPFRSVQAPAPSPAVALSLLPLPSPLPSPTRSVSSTSAYSSSPSIYASTPQGGAIEREFVSCGIEKGYAKTWTSRCPSLEDVQFGFSYSMNEVDVELCGVWFRRKAGGGKPARGM